MAQPIEKQISEALSSALQLAASRLAGKVSGGMLQLKLMLEQDTDHPITYSLSRAVARDQSPNEAKEQLELDAKAMLERFELATGKKYLMNVEVSSSPRRCAPGLEAVAIMVSE